MVVPVVRRAARAAPDLDEPDSALEQTAGQEAPAAEVRRGGVVEAVERSRRRGFAGEVEGLGVALHSGRQLVGGDPRFQARVALVGLGMAAVEPGEHVQALAPAVGGEESGRVGREEVGDRLRRRRVEDRALVRLRQEAGREVSLGVVRQAARVGQDHEGRQVVDQRSEAVRKPGAEAREARHQEPAVHHVARRAVDVRLRREGHQERQVVHALREFRGRRC